jgi:hypothetical protein
VRVNNAQRQQTDDPRCLAISPYAGTDPDSCPSALAPSDDVTGTITWTIRPPFVRARPRVSFWTWPVDSEWRPKVGMEDGNPFIKATQL